MKEKWTSKVKGKGEMKEKWTSQVKGKGEMDFYGQRERRNGLEIDF